MKSAQPTPLLDGAPPPGNATDAPSSDATALREAMLVAIGELSDAERERLGSVDQPDDMAHAWRDLIAERAAREREATVRTELTREFETRSRAAQPRPTSGLRGGAPPAAPSNVAQWTDYIRSSGDGSIQQQRRSQFADWLAAHPDA